MKIGVLIAGEHRWIRGNPGPSLLEFLQAESIPVNAACGGKGSCNKCRVRVTDGFLAVTAADQKAFTTEEIAEGWRLSCQARPKSTLECGLPSLESVKRNPRLQRLKPEPLSWAEPRLVVALGSTGVVAALVDKNGGAISESHRLNQQVLLGADVMSRLHYVQQNGNDRARALLHSTVDSVLASLKDAHPKAFAEAAQFPVLVSGNSVMMSLLHGWDSASLAVAPFRPLKLTADASALPSGIQVESLPLLGGFVGADALAGALSIEMKFHPSKTWALVDIGTNTEIIIKNADGKYYFSSAPAGPAFEGGNILCGMRAEAGAIAVARYKSDRWEIETIGADKAQGICGSGLFDLIHEGVEAGLIHRDGYLPGGRLPVTGDVKIIADDIREFQLAKAATRTAFDILADRAGGAPSEIYLAGTFAQHLRLDSLDGVGILPAQIPKVIVGNASLDGLCAIAHHSDDQRRALFDRLLNHSVGIELALESDFQERFVQNINF